MLPQTKLARYARELLKMKLEAAERDGIEAKDCEAFTDLFRDGFVEPAGEERTQEERQPFKRSVRGPKFDPASKTGRIRTRFFELWNGGNDSFYIDDMLDISCDEMQKALYSRIAPLPELEGFTISTKRDQHDQILYIQVEKKATTT